MKEFISIHYRIIGLRDPFFFLTEPWIHSPSWRGEPLFPSRLHHLMIIICYYPEVFSKEWRSCQGVHTDWGSHGWAGAETIRICFCVLNVNWCDCNTVSTLMYQYWEEELIGNRRWSAPTKIKSSPQQNLYAVCYLGIPRGKDLDFWQP